MIEERANENREMRVVLSYDSSTLQKKMVVFINLIEKLLTQESNGDVRSM